MDQPPAPRAQSHSTAVTDTAPSSSRFAQWGANVARYLADPPRAFEVALWVLLVFAIIAIRAYLIHLVPVHLWSQDAGSYSWTVWKWLKTGLWETDPRRGPTYSLFIAMCLKLWGTFDSVMVLQHVLGGLAVLAAAIVLRLQFGRRAMVPIFLCGYSLAVYGQPLHMGHLIRNETLLFFLSTAALTAWFLAIRHTGRDADAGSVSGRGTGTAWLWVSGIAAGLLTLTKNVIAPFPLVVLGGIVWMHRRHGRWTVTAKQTASFLLALALPFIGAKVLHRLTVHGKPPEPQSGLLLFGRVAQFTVLDGGIEPEIKALIRQDVEDYRAHIARTGKLENNIPLNRTAVPRIRSLYRKTGRSPAELNRLFRRIAIEAILAHPGEYAAQMWRDFLHLQLKSASTVKDPDHNDMRSTRKTLSETTEQFGMRIAYSSEQLAQREDKRHFRRYRRTVMTAWLFNLVPGLLTSISVTALMFFTRGRDRLWFIGLAAVWWFTMLLLCTVGRPLDRYMIPVVPVMFWSMSTVVILGWLWLLGRLRPGRGSGPGWK